MHNIGIIPNHAEIFCCRLQSRQCANGIIGIRDAVGIRIFRHAEHAFDFRVFDKFADFFNVRAVLRHFHVNHFNAEMLTNRKVTVIAGHVANKFHTVLQHPRRIAGNAFGHALCNIVKHEV